MKEGHLPVLVEEVMSMLAPAPGSLQIDATVGGGGHTERILEATDPDGRLLGLDADGAAIARVGRSPPPRFGDRLVLRQANFRELRTVAPDGRLRRRRRPAVRPRPVELPARPTPSAASASGPAARSTCASTRRRGVPAAELLATLDADRADGALPALRRGAAAPAGSPARSSTPARPRRSRPPRSWPRSSSGSRPATPAAAAGSTRRRASSRRSGSPSTRSSTPSRTALAAAVDLLRPGGRLVVLSYHSLEDRIVKRFLAAERRGCVCPPELPVCVCGRNPRLRLVTRPSLTPTAAEIAANPRARSARLRAAERLAA